MAITYRMPEPTDYLDLLTRGAQVVMRRAVELANASHVALTAMRWHRGVEVSDLDDYWLVLELGNRATSEHFETGFLMDVAMGRSTELVTARLKKMISDLVDPPQDAEPIRRSVGPASDPVALTIPDGIQTLITGH